MIAAPDMRQAASDHAVMEPAPIVKAFGWTNAQTAFVIAISYLFGTITMILGVALRRHPRTRRHVGGPLLLTALALCVPSYIAEPATTTSRYLCACYVA
jgi:hypothetical protein